MENYDDITQRYLDLPTVGPVPLADKYGVSNQPMAPNFAPQVGAVQLEPSGGGAVPMQAPTAGINPTLQAMLEQYSKGSVDYGPDIRAARKARATNEAAFNTTLDKLLKGTDQGPSKSEMYFRLAAALGEPTKFGGFAESLGPVSKALGEYQSDLRKAKQANLQTATQIALKKQEMSLENAKEEEKTLLALQSEQNKDKREFIKSAIKDYLDSGKPQSEAGKIAKDKGFTVGTQGFQDEVDKQTKILLEKQMAMINATLAGIGVQRGQLDLATKKEERAASELDPTELKMLMENKQGIRSSDSAVKLMDEASTLVDKAFTKSPADQAEYRRLKTTNPSDPRVVATEQLEQILTTSGLAGLKAAFGGNVTEGERNVQLLTQGLGATSAESRRQIINRVKNGLLANRKFYDDANKELLSGEYKKRPTSKE